MTPSAATAVVSQVASSLFNQANDATPEVRIDSHGVFVRTPAARVEVSGRGVFVGRQAALAQQPLPAPPSNMDQAQPIVGLSFLSVIAIVLAIALMRRRLLGVALLTILGVFLVVRLVSQSRWQPPRTVEDFRWSPDNENSQAPPVLMPDQGRVTVPEAAPAPWALAAPGAFVTAEPAAESAVEPAAELAAISVAESGAAVPVGPSPQPATSGTAEPDSPILLFEGESSQGSAAETLPEWVTTGSDRQNPHSVTREGLVTLSSELFASTTDAEQQLWIMAQVLSGKFLNSRWPNVPEAAGWLPSQASLQQAHLILRRCVEQTQLVVGEFSPPMYRVHWQLDFTDDVARRLVRDWEPLVKNARMEHIFLSIFGITAAFGLLNLVLRAFGMAWRRKSIGHGAVAVVLAAVAAGGAFWLLRSKVTRAENLPITTATSVR